MKGKEQDDWLMKASTAYLSYGKLQPLHNLLQRGYVGGSRPITVFRPDKMSFSSQSDKRQPLILRQVGSKGLHLIH